MRMQLDDFWRDKPQKPLFYKTNINFSKTDQLKNEEADTNISATLTTEYHGGHPLTH